MTDLINESTWTEWVPLEANEDYIKKLGINGVKCEEIWSFDDHIPIIEKPYYALILCYSNFEHVKQLMERNYEACDAIIPEGVFFAQQKIRNACGTFALIHAITQNLQNIDIGNGVFAKWFETAKKHGVGDRSDLLANDLSFTVAHQSQANTGSTTVTEADRNPDSHYICYVNVNDCLYEFDSRMTFPRNCGPTSADTLLFDAAQECRKITNVVDNVDFSAIALIGQ